MDIKPHFFVKVPNAFFERCEEKVSPKELYLYYLLQMRSLFINFLCTITNVTLLSQEVTFNNSPDKNKREIRNILLSLRQKGHIFFHGESVDNNTLIIINFADCSGFTQIQPNIYFLAANSEEFAILCLVKKWAGVKGYGISYPEFAFVLERSERHAIKVISEMERQGKITKNRGKYLIGENRQEMNSYKVNEDYDLFEIKQDERDEIKDKVKDRVNDETITAIDKTGESITEKRPHHWYDCEAFIDEHDCYVYLTSEDTELKKKAAKRIAVISRSEKGKTRIDELFKKAEAQFDKEKRELEDEAKKQEIEKIMGKSKSVVVELTNGNLRKYSPDVDEKDIKTIYTSVSRFHQQLGDYLSDILEVPLYDYQEWKRKAIIKFVIEHSGIDESYWDEMLNQYLEDYVSAQV